MQLDELTMMKESSLPVAFGTPNDVRLFPGSTARSAPNPSTRRIPIINSERSLTEIQQDEDEALAEYRDRAMYLRIVSGMKEKSASTSQLTLENCVAKSVAKIARTRNSQLVRDDDSGHYLVKEQPQSVCDTRLGYRNVLTSAVFLDSPEEEGIFDMDL